MKNIRLYIGAVCAMLTLTLTQTSCTDYLDKAPDSDVSPTDAFKDF